jgi:hypothetical protein
MLRLLRGVSQSISSKLATKGKRFNKDIQAQSRYHTKIQTDFPIPPLQGFFFRLVLLGLGLASENTKALLMMVYKTVPYCC